jgi:hypothetical protein
VFARDNTFLIVSSWNGVYKGLAIALDQPDSVAEGVVSGYQVRLPARQAYIEVIPEICLIHLFRPACGKIIAEFCTSKG